MRKEKMTPSPKDYVVAAFMLGTTALGACRLVKLGYDWSMEGVHVFKSKKN
jgi:hypothetical protein